MKATKTTTQQTIKMEVFLPDSKAFVSIHKITNTNPDEAFAFVIKAAGRSSKW